MGASKVVMEFCSQASHFGIECVPICLVRGARDSSEYTEALKEIGIRCERIVERGRFDPRGLIQLSALIRRYRPDVIEAHGHREVFYLLALRPFQHFLLVGYFHGWTEASCWTRETSPLSSLVWKCCPVVVTVCHNFKERLCRQGAPESKIHVFYNGIDPALNRARPAGATVRRELNIPADSPVVSVIGRLSAEKGQANFLRAFEQVARQRPDVRALIVGDGPDRNDLQRLTQDLGLGSRVIFTGYQRDVRKYYEATSVLVVPSKSEGMPNVVLEAMVFGVPIVSTRVGGVPEIIQDGKNGLLVPPQDPVKLTEAVLEVIADTTLAQRLARTAREETLAKFSTLERCARIADFYRTITA